MRPCRDLSCHDSSSRISTFMFREYDNFMNVREEAAPRIRAQYQTYLMKNVNWLNLVGGMLHARKNGYSCCRAMRTRARFEFDSYKCKFTRRLREDDEGSYRFGRELIPLNGR